jgi:hypothetical protein
MTEPTEIPLAAWERMPGETPLAHQAARAYFNMGASRSLAKVAAQFGRLPKQMERWSRRWKWAIRSAAFDDHRAREEQIELDRLEIARVAKWHGRREEESEQKYQLAQKLLGKGGKLLDVPLTKAVTRDGKTNLFPVKCALRDVVPILALGFKLGGEAIQQEIGQKNDRAPEEWPILDYN